MKIGRSAAGVVASTILVALVLIPGISSAQDSATPSPAGSAVAPSNDTFIFADTSEPSSLNPIKGYLGTDYTIWAIEYNLPIEFGLNFEADLKNSITTSVDTSSDNMTFTYHMRPNMKWSDGQPFTANDVAWTLNFYKKNAVSNYSSDLTLMTTADAPDDTTFVIHTSKPTTVYSGDTPFMYEYILPEHIWSKFKTYDEAKQFTDVPAVGSGPFVVTQYKQGQYVKLEANKYFWGKDIGLAPHIDTVIYQIFNDENQEAAALQNGEIDYAYFDSANVLNALKGKANVATNGGQIPLFDELGFNTGSDIQTDPAGGFEPHGDPIHAVTDPAFRRAMRHAVDSQAIAEKVFGGYATPADSPVQPTATTGNWDPPADQIKFSIPLAQQQLAAAGYKDTDNNGIVNDPKTGEDVVLRYYVQTNDKNTTNTAPFVQDWFKQAGVGTKVIAVSSAKLGNIINDGTYDMFHWGWYPNPDPSVILSEFLCDQRPPGGGKYGNDDAYFCNPEYDKLYEDQLTATSATQRANIVHQMQQIFWDNMPYIMLTYDDTLAAWRTDRFTGYLKQPEGNGDLLATWGFRSFANIRPVSGSSGEATAEGGISAGLWIAIAAAIVVVIAIILLVRRRGSDEERA
jgi:peptide/nickel transport system substrate-binding protein